VNVDAILAEEEEANYVTEEEQEPNKYDDTQEEDEIKSHANNKTDEDNVGIEEDVIMRDNNEQETSEDDNEITNSTNNRPRRQNAGAGVKQLEMGHGTKEYASITNKQFLTVKGEKIGARERGAKELFMSVAVDVLFVQVGEFSQMTAKAGIKRFGDRPVAAMLQEFKQLKKEQSQVSQSLVQ
jgi:hypothetical protein